MYSITALYKFSPISPVRLEVLKGDILSFCELNEVKGLFLLSHEGCNATMSGLPEAIRKFKQFMNAIPEFEGIIFKDSSASFQPFRRLKLDIPGGRNNHIDPHAWHALLESDEDILVLDTRNKYETEIGMFEKAVDPKIENFSDFPQFVEEQKISKDKKILMYCTGGIRCEKALLYMQQEGFKNVFQLEGGILNYLQHFPNGKWNGECFVFDHRVALDSNLEPTKQYSLCPHCGNPAKEKISCAVCGDATIVCHHCLAIETRDTCSKNCAHHRGRRGKSSSTQTEMR